ncbi:hypothetical protein GCK32_017276 [Trichostrongylus colubriformis]|uniref:Peptidase M16 N-terminal domain-containing protein n=1 Tax=Trichostrongylus colubriformis TaxID=6319 RepID=A0AAN8FS00_TRICO
MAAAAMDVNVGHLMDPWELPGLAHFCEHMVFLGTEKYPSEKEFHKFVSDHGGYRNASTGTDNTNYHFHIKADQLKEALDRFAQFFLAPKFTESATKREVLAIDSENSKSLKVDNYRIAQVKRRVLFS